MFISDREKDALISEISKYGGYAVSMLAERTGEEANHPNTYCAGYMQGYAHAADMACNVIAHCEDLK